MRGADFDTYLAAYLVKPGLGSYEVGALATFDERLAEASAPASVLANRAAAEQGVEEESLHEQRKGAPVAG